MIVHDVIFPSARPHGQTDRQRHLHKVPDRPECHFHGSYGAQLLERLAAVGLDVCEPSTMPPRHGVGKNDELDALRIARSVLGVGVDELRRPRTDSGPRVALPVLVVAREDMAADRTRGINTLTALLRTIDLGVDARRPLTARQVTVIAGWRARDEPAWLATCRDEAVRPTQHIRALDRDLAANRTLLDALAAAQAPGLTALTGVGSVVAATVLIAWSHPGRVRSEAAFAAIAGTCPIPASSGNTVRHRLNRGGDRRLNRALHTVVLVWMRVDPATRAHVARRRAEGRTTKEIMRSLKCDITRQLFRVMPAAAPATQSQVRTVRGTVVPTTRHGESPCGPVRALRVAVLPSRRGSAGPSPGVRRTPRPRDWSLFRQQSPA